MMKRNSSINILFSFIYFPNPCPPPSECTVVLPFVRVPLQFVLFIHHFDKCTDNFQLIFCNRSVSYVAFQSRQMQFNKKIMRWLTSSIVWTAFDTTYETSHRCHSSDVLHAPLVGTPMPLLSNTSFREAFQQPVSSTNESFNKPWQYEVFG